jgi:Mce-associated membrane protein
MSDDGSGTVEPGSDPDDAPPTRQVRELPRWSLVLVALLTVVLVGGAGWTGLQVHQAHQAAAADDAALAAGREAAVVFTSYDYRHLGADLRRVEDMSTGRFRDQFTTAMGTLTEAITHADGVSVGRVVYAGLRERKHDRAVVLAAVDATVNTSMSTRPSIRRYRLQITLDGGSGRWLIADIAPVA